MLERGDMATLHEPFLYLYYVHDARKRLPHLDVDRRRAASYEAIRSMILETARTRPVFVKDMCYYVVERIRDDEAFIRRMISTFLVRDPARSIPSYYRLDPGVTLEEIGCEAQYRCFERFAEVTGRTPVGDRCDGPRREPGGHAPRVLPGAGVAVRSRGAGVERGAAASVAGRRRLARRPRRLDRNHRTPVGARPRTGCGTAPPRLLRASPALLSQDAGASAHAGVAYLIRSAGLSSLLMRSAGAPVGSPGTGSRRLRSRSSRFPG